MNEESKKHILRALTENVRYDGRKDLDYREMSLEVGVARNAEGSARIKIGNTEVIVGIKMELGKPYPDTPNEGCLMVGAELLPLSNPAFESGPPSIQAVELARVVDRGIRESHAIDIKKLCITPGELVWFINIDICSINDEGNLFDAASIATIAALKDTKLPGVKNNLVDYKSKTKTPLPLNKEPIEVTVHKIGDKFIIDPLTEEEAVIDGRLTVCCTKEGNICALQKGGDYPLTAEDIAKMVEIALTKSKELRKLL
jgi:exosome complex component RRP42